MATQRDYYEILGVPKAASGAEIKTAHRRLVRKFHPDVNKSDKSAEAKFKEVQEAYDILSDDKKRKAYDQFGHAGVSSTAAAEAAAAAAAAGAGGRGGPSGFRYSTSTPGGATVDFGDVDMNEILEQMMGGSRGGRRGSSGGRARNPFARQPEIEMEEAAIPDLTHEASIPFETAVKGGTLELRISGADGSNAQNITVKIPPGVDIGSKIRVRGQGQMSHSGTRGDIIITIKTIEPHRFFTRAGNDILLDLPISLTEALRGATISVPTLDGPVELRVPAGISSGKRLRVKERGVAQRSGTRGDQFCRILIQIPADLSDEEKNQITGIEQKHTFNPRRDAAW